MKTHIIQLEPHDDTLSARDKMAWSKAPRILLVWPRKEHVLERPVDLFILQRHALSLGAQLGVVTSIGEVRAIATELGIPAFSSAVQAQRGSWRKPRGRRRINWRTFRPHTSAEALREQREELGVRVEESPRTRRLAFSAGVLAVLALALFFLPAAVVELSPERQVQSLSLSVWAGPQIKTANPSGGMPAFVLSAVVEGSEQAPSSGRVSIPDRQASGEVEFSNLVDQQIEIPAGSVVLAKSPLVQRFETTRAVTLSAGLNQKVTAPVRALLPGTQGNIPAGSIEALEGSLGLNMLATNPAAFQGGSNRFSPSPQESDYEAVQLKLVASLRATALEDLLRQLQPGQRLVEGTLRVSKTIQETREPLPGEPGDFARLSQQVEYSAWFVREEDLAAVARTALEANRPAGFQPLPEAMTMEFSPDVILDADGNARWEMAVTRTLESVWSNDAAARALVGRSPEDAKRVLNRMIALSAPPVVTLYPGWWGRMPFLSFRIEVIRR
jgi:hypothetical protein